jgi:hypothetical protein
VNAVERGSFTKKHAELIQEVALGETDLAAISKDDAFQESSAGDTWRMGKLIVGSYSTRLYRD